MHVEFEDLRRAVDWSVRQLEVPRKNRVSAVEQFVGTWYSTGGSDRRVPVNFLEMATTIYSYQLASRAPRAMVTSHSRQLKPFAKDLELALNEIPEEIGLGETLQSAVLEALFSYGVVKVGIASGGVVVLGYDAGETFVDLVSMDDYFVDMTAKSRKTIQFEGNDYWLPLHLAKEIMGEYDENPESSVVADEHTVTGDQGESRTEAISADAGGEVYKERVWLRDVWLPQEGRLVTYGVKSLQLFKDIEWDGPEHGPYYSLGFSTVPGNLLPLPPVALWRDMHELGNTLFRKLGRQADAKKTVAAFQGGGDDDANALKGASDGEAIRYSGQPPVNLTVGGIDAPTLAFFLQIKDQFSWQAGNLDSLGGLAPMTDTVGQDKLLSEAANARINHMRSKVHDFARDIFKALAWYEWTDPVRVRNLNKKVPGSDISIPVLWSNETREGDFLDYNTDIDVYSMQEDSPAIRLQKIGQALERFVFPMIEQFQQQGGQIDFQELLEVVADLGNIPELKDIVQFGEPYEEADTQGGSDEPTTKPDNTTKTYEHVSRPGATRHGKDDVMARGLMGIGVQESEAAVIGRPVS